MRADTLILTPDKTLWLKQPPLGLINFKPGGAFHVKRGGAHPLGADCAGGFCWAHEVKPPKRR